MKRISVQNNTHTKTLLYSVVFDMRAIRYAVMLLFGAFLIQPVAPVFADELIVEIETVEESADELVEEVSEPAPEETEEVTEEENTDTDTEVEVSDGALEENADDDELFEVENQEELDEVVSDEPVDDSADEQETSSGDEDILGNDSEVATEETHTSSGSSDQGTNDEDEDSVITDEPDPVLEPEEEIDTLTALSQSLASSTVNSQESTTTSPVVNEESDMDELPDTTTVPTSTVSVSGETSSTTDATDTTQPVSDTSNDQSGETEEETETDIVAGNDELDTLVSDTDGETDQVVGELATSTDEIIENSAPPTPSVSYVHNNLNKHQFDDTQCVSVGGGAFYCSGTEDAPEYIEDGVFVDSDSDGDTEIYVRVDGEVAQISHNIVDDAAPYYDARSERIVWHTLKNDRYQIVSYDLESTESTLLTNETYNNMEPVAYGDITLWQAWIGGNWEIMMFDNGQVTQLTDNEMHDVAPHIRGGHIVWQTQFAQGWEVAVYDSELEKIEYIASGDGERVENPRFVLVYDSLDDNGDIRTVGYDFDTRSSFALGSMPGETPERLPEPDQTGETRALIQNKSHSRETEIEDVEPVPTSATSTGSTINPDALSTDTGTTSDSHTGDVVITPFASTTQAVSDENISEDVLVNDTTDVQSKDVDHIEDIVIPPLVSTTTAEIG